MLPLKLSQAFKSPSPPGEGDSGDEVKKQRRFWKRVHEIIKDYAHYVRVILLECRQEI